MFCLTVIAVTISIVYRLPNTLQKNDIKIIVVTKVPLIEMHSTMFFLFKLNNMKNIAVYLKKTFPRLAEYCHHTVYV